ncbi:putative non-specific serine/threonine protein kinase [Helianthus annuus]|nr:putative non-specific serine/threonine protein kinase [Helianthus annuus]
MFLSSISTLNLDGITLLSFKHSLLPHQPSLLQNWNQFDPTPCSWSGVTCSPFSGPVTGLSLPNSHLPGSIPIELARLKRLRVLNLSDNSLNGTLPISIFTTFQSLHVLNLSNNYLFDGIPTGFDYVNILALSSNSFSGALPLLLSGESLNYLNLSRNKLSISVSGINVLDLSSNSFSVAGGSGRRQVMQLPMVVVV